MPNKTLVLLLFLCMHVYVNAQDINCKTIVLDNQIQLSDKRIFRSLEQSISDFVNNNKWTTEKIQPNEKIELTIQIIPSKFDITNNYIEASAQIICQRPVYGSNYTTSTFNFLDEDWKFYYIEYQRMDFNENSFTNNLTSLLAFYVFYAIGQDFDSYGLQAGTFYFNKALVVANNAQNSDGSSGWKPFNKSLRTRYNLIDNVLNPRFDLIREAWYIYHRKGLDQMYKSTETGRKNIFASLEKVQKVFAVAPNTVILLVFFEAKSDELVSIYKGGSSTEKTKAIQLLSEINIANINKYEKIRQ